MRMNPADKFNNRFAVMVILGDFILPKQKMFWLDEMLSRLSWLDVLERTGRSTLARMAKDGWFEIEKVGRRNRYWLTNWGESVLRQGDLRVFENAVQDWDGSWHLLTYSIPDEKRVLRHNLVQQLEWLGFGRISRGTWLSPYDRRDALQKALKAPETSNYLHFFAGDYLGNTDIDQLIARCWDFETVGKEYGRFIDTHRPVLEIVDTNGSDPSLEDAFRYRFWLSHDFLPLLRIDPNLPKQFLPNAWIGFEARQLYSTIKSGISFQAPLFSE